MDERHDTALAQDFKDTRLVGEARYGRERGSMAGGEKLHAGNLALIHLAERIDIFTRDAHIDGEIAI